MESINKKSHFECKLGMLSRPDGSVMFSEGNTTVIVGIYGPVEVKIQKLLIDKASVECHYRPKTGLPGIKDRLYESVIRNICETSLVASLYPRTAISVAIQELQDSGQLISCAINAACLACLNAGIDMKFMFGSVTCYLNFEEQLTLSSLTEKETKAIFVLVFDSKAKKIIASYTKGSFSKEQYEEAIELSREGSEDVFEYYKNVLIRQ